MGLAVGFGRQVPGRLAPTSPRDRRAVDGAFCGPRGSPTSVCPDCPARCPATELGARARMLMVGECAVVQPAPEDRLCFPVGQLRATVGHANQPEQSLASFLYRSGHGGGIFRPGIGRLPGHLDDRPIELWSTSHSSSGAWLPRPRRSARDLAASASLQLAQRDPSFGEHPSPECPTHEGPQTESAPPVTRGLSAGTRAWTQTKAGGIGQPIGRRSAGSHDEFTRA